MAQIAFDLLADESPAEEREEPKVEAMPRLTRDALGYLEPRPGIDGKQMFGACAACQHFVPEAAMMGAVYGSRCALFGSQFSITDDDTCDLFVPWGSGIPCEAVVLFNAVELRKGIPNGVDPFWAGWHSKQSGQCRNCRFHDHEPNLPPGKVECELFEALEEQAPNLYALDKVVDIYGGCCQFQAKPPEPTEPTQPGMRLGSFGA